MNPSVSIIIPTYNRCTFLRETLESVRCQNYQDWECLVVDDGSNDYTEELMDFYCDRDKRLRFFRRPKVLPKGANSCRNYGFEKSRGHYINWFDDDDVMLANFLSERRNYMELGVEIILCSFYRVDEDLKKKFPVKLEKSFDLFKSYALYELKMVTNSMLVNRRILENQTLFLPGLEYGDETEFFLRLFYRKPEPEHVIVDQPLFLYRQHASTKTEKIRGGDPAFKFAVIYVALQNLARGIELRDSELTQFYYKRLISFFFRSIESGQKENAGYLLNAMIPEIMRINKPLAIEIFLWGKSFILLGRGSHKIEHRLKKMQLFR